MERAGGRVPALWLDVAVKVTLVGLLAFGAFSGLQQFEGKAFGARLATYPLALLVVPAAWWLVGRARSSLYPYDIDVLLGLSGSVLAAALVARLARGVPGAERA